jgi:hypothetical protein
MLNAKWFGRHLTRRDGGWSGPRRKRWGSTPVAAPVQRKRISLERRRRSPTRCALPRSGSFALARWLSGLVASGIGLFNESILAQRGFAPEIYHRALAITAMRQPATLDTDGARSREGITRSSGITDFSPAIRRPPSVAKRSSA